MPLLFHKTMMIPYISILVLLILQPLTTWASKSTVNVPKFNIPSMPRPVSSSLPNSSPNAESEDEMVDKRRLTLRRNNRIYVSEPHKNVVESYHFSQKTGKLIPTPSPLIRHKSSNIGSSESEVEPSTLPERLFRKMQSSLMRQKKMTTTTLKGIIYGPPAAGKGTQCEVITSQFGVVHLSTGDILRSAIANNTPLGNEQISYSYGHILHESLLSPITADSPYHPRFIATGIQAKPYMDSGSLVPDDLVIELILNRLRQEDCESRGWLLDGFPRTEAQADALLKAGIIPDVFLVLDVPEEILVERVTGRRTDPVTGKIYHMTFKPPETPEIAARVVQRSGH